MNDQLLKNIYPSSKSANRAKYMTELDEAMNLYNINTVNRKRAFISQLGHECSQLSVMSENLNYSSTALRSIFHNYFLNDSIAG